MLGASLVVFALNVLYVIPFSSLRVFRWIETLNWNATWLVALYFFVNRPKWCHWYEIWRTRAEFHPPLPHEKIIYLSHIFCLLYVNKHSVTSAWQAQNAAICCELLHTIFHIFGFCLPIFTKFWQNILLSSLKASERKKNYC